VRIGLAQVNTTVGDLEGNLDRCVAAVEAACAEGAELTVLPEMAVPGHHPRDLLLDPGFLDAVLEANGELARRTRAASAVVVGTVARSGLGSDRHPGLMNVALLLHNGLQKLEAAQRLLPCRDVCFDPRWFLPGSPGGVTWIGEQTCGILLGGDLLETAGSLDPPADLIAAGADVLLCPAATSYVVGAFEGRLRRAARCPVPVVLVNACGANDELILDGRSFVTDGRGAVLARLRAFDEEVRVVDLGTAEPAPVPAEDGDEDLWLALVLGVRDFARKNRVDRAFLGLSGGVDSSLVAAIAAEALGPDRVTGVAIPSRYTDPRSTECARTLAANLGIGFEEVALEPLHAAAETTLGPLLEVGTGAENVQARLRATILMAFVNRYGGMLLNTSNKTELALGYGTLYGDLAGALCPIGDLGKPAVVALARWVAAIDGAIPQFALERPPTAELRPDQVDPWDYSVIAPELERAMCEHRNHPALLRSEHKRRQLGVVLKVSPCSFGSGRLVPLTCR